MFQPLLLSPLQIYKNHIKVRKDVTISRKKHSCVERVIGFKCNFEEYYIIYIY